MFPVWLLTSIMEVGSGRQHSPSALILTQHMWHVQWAKLLWGFYFVLTSRLRQYGECLSSNFAMKTLQVLWLKKISFFSKAIILNSKARNTLRESGKSHPNLLLLDELDVVQSTTNIVGTFYFLLLVDYILTIVPLLYLFPLTEMEVLVETLGSEGWRLAGGSALWFSPPSWAHGPTSQPGAAQQQFSEVFLLTSHKTPDVSCLN